VLAFAPRPAGADVSLVDSGTGRELALRSWPGGGYGGRVSLDVRNDGDALVTLGVRYLRDDGRRPIVVGQDGSSASEVLRLVHAKQSLRVPPQAVAQLALRFHLAPGLDASALDGMLVVRARPVPRHVRRRERQRPTPVRPCRRDPPDDPPPGDPPPDDGRSGDSGADKRMLLHVDGSFAAPPGIELEPAKLTLHTRENLPFGRWIRGRGAKVSLTGAGAQRLLADGGRLTGTALLRNDDGHAISVRWRVRDGSAEVWVDGNPAAGAYSGTLPLLANTAAPALALTVTDQHNWIWAFLAVLAGTFVGGFLPVIGALQRRKVLLVATIRQVILDYREERGFPPAPPPTWVDRELGSAEEPWRTRTWMADPKRHGAAGFFSMVRWARDEAELDDATNEAINIQASVRHWIQQAPAVAALRELVEDEQGLDPIDGRAWRTTTVYHDSRMRLREAQRPPVTDDATEQRIELLERQHERHEQLARAWRTIAEADDLGPHRAELVAELLALANPTDADEPHDDASWDRCLERGEQLLRDLRSARTTARVTPVVAPAAAGVTGLFSLPLRALRPARDAVAAAYVAAGERASSLSARIWRVLRRAWPGAGATPAELVRNLWWSDLAYTVVATLVAVVGYTVGVYDDTFGSPADYAKAFGVGLGTQALARWVAMPIFDSIRLRRAHAAEEARATRRTRRASASTRAGSSAAGRSA
jgi:hypothetical protein